MAKDNSRMGASGDSCRVDVILPEFLKHLCSRGPCKCGHETDSYCNHGIPRSWAEHRSEHKRQDEKGKGLNRINDTHDNPCIKKSPVIPCNQSDWHANPCTHHERSHADFHGRASPEQNSGQLISPKLISSKPMMRRWRLKNRAVINLIWTIRRNIGSQQRNTKNEKHQDTANHERWVREPNSPSRQIPRRCGRLLHGRQMGLGYETHASIPPSVRMRGSIRLYMRSMSKFTMITMSAATSAVPCTVV